MTKFAEVQALGLSIEERPRTVVDKFVYVLGYKLNATDLFETLHEVKAHASGIHMTNPTEVEAMKLIGVIESTSGSWGTTKGPNFDSFMTMLDEAIDP